MKWFDKLLKKRPNGARYAPTLSGYSPIYSQFGTNIYASDVVVQAIKCIVDEMKKLKPMHIRIRDNEPVPVDKSSIQTVLDNPNALMTTSEFLEKMVWLLMMNYNAFIIPTYYEWTDNNGMTRRSYESLYPVNPTQVDFIEDAAGRLFVSFTFGGGYKTTVAYEDVIHIKYNYSVNPYMGGNAAGQPDHSALLKTLDLNQTLLQGVAKAMKASYAVNGVIKYNALIDDGKMKAALDALEKKLENNESGILPLDLRAEFVPLKNDIQIVDEATLKFVDEKILRNFGVPLPILTGDYTQDCYNAFYQKTLEPLIIAISQAFTKKIFTDRERAFGNRIELYPKDLIFMTVQQTLQMIEILSPTGAMTENEKRVALGMRPLPELEGRRYMSLNWIDADEAARYQIGKLDEEKE